MPFENRESDGLRQMLRFDLDATVMGRGRGDRDALCPWVQRRDGVDTTDPDAERTLARLREGLTLDYLPQRADVRVGDRVVTAGTDGLYPRGLPLGVVVEVSSEGELLHSIRLVPAVDFGVLDQVFVLIRDSIPATLEGTTSASP